VIGTYLQSYVHPDDYIIILNYIKQIINSEKVSNSPVYRIKHSDGEWHFHTGNAALVYGSGGAVKSIVGVSRDITERIVFEEKIKNLLSEKELILKEVHHRVKNNMSTILNLLTLQLDMQESPETKGVLFDAAGRVQSMMVLYDKLYRSDSESLLSLKEYFTALVEEIISIFPGKTPVKIILDIENIMLSTKLLSPLGIIINELITNSMKYAFPECENPMISLTVIEKQSRVQIVFRDNGKGIPESVSFENSTGFGMQLISMLTSQIGGKIRIERNAGTCFKIDFGIG
jgi:two-component sensor histidine kinase